MEGSTFNTLELNINIWLSCSRSVIPLSNHLKANCTQYQDMYINTAFVSCMFVSKHTNFKNSTWVHLTQGSYLSVSSTCFRVGNKGIPDLTGSFCGHIQSPILKEKAQELKMNIHALETWEVTYNVKWGYIICKTRIVFLVVALSQGMHLHFTKCDLKIKSQQVERK